jgi:flavorubredoxin
MITLFDSGGHRNLMFNELCSGEMIQANQHLIIHGKEAMLLDPGGHKVFSLSGIPDEGMTVMLGGQPIEIIPAHYLHSPGNYHVYDPVAKILYSGDIGASVGIEYADVPNFADHLKYTEGFHRRYMASNRALREWVGRVRKLDIEIMAPQHGAQYRGKAMVAEFLAWAEQLACGVDLIPG